WLPETTNVGPVPPGWVMETVSTAPSPHSIVAEKSDRGAILLASPNVATWPLKGTPAMTLIGLVDRDKGASLMTALLPDVETMKPPSSVTITEIGYVPSSA